MLYYLVFLINIFNFDITVFLKVFSFLHLPKHDDIVVLMDENEEEFASKYLVDKNGLSGDWRGFSIAHNFPENDTLVFQLIKHCKFKVIPLKCLNYDHFIKIRDTFS